MKVSWKLISANEIEATLRVKYESEYTLGQIRFQEHGTYRVRGHVIKPIVLIESTFLRFRQQSADQQSYPDVSPTIMQSINRHWLYDLNE